MKRVKFIAAAMAVFMLMPLFTSCSSSGKRGANVVKADDPWYESSKFKLEYDRKKGEDGCDSFISVSNDRIFSLYYVTPDMWASTKTILDTYDYEGNLLNRQKVSFPDNLELNDLYRVNVDPEGKTITAVVEFCHPRNNEPAFIDIDTESGEVTNIKNLFDEDVKKAIKPGFVFDGIVSSGSYTVAVTWGNTGGDTNRQMFLFKDGKYVRDLDMTNIHFIFFMGYISVNESSNSIFIGFFALDDNFSVEWDMKTGKQKSVRSFRELGGDENDFAEYTATYDGDLCKIDSLGNITRIDTDTLTPKTIINSNWYTPYFYPPYAEDQGVTSNIIYCSEEKTVIMDFEYILYGSDVPERNFYIRILTKADKNPHAGKEVIKIALPPNSGVSDYLAKTIYEFNRTDNEYLLRIWDKYNTGFNLNLAYGAMSPKDEDDQEVYKMIQELKSDDAPDIVLNVQKNYAMRDDVFMEITDFLDPEVMDKQYKNIIEAGKIDGKLYFLPVTVEIEGLVTNKSLLKDGAVGITFDEFEKLIKTKMSGFSPYDYPNSNAYNKRTFLLSCIDTKRAIEGNKVEFGTDQFRAAVQYAKDNFVYDNENSVPKEYVQDWSRYRGECYYAKIGDYLDFITACYKPKESYKIIGTPSTDASGPRFKATETVSVAANTAVKDGCKKFLNYMFSGAAYNSDECEFRFIVTNKEIMDRNIESLTKHNNDTYADFMESITSGHFIPAAGYEKAFGDKEATDDMRDSFKESLSSISTYYYEDHTIVQFVEEELAPYYAGDRSLDEAIRYINDRVTKYVREM